ncbi:MAG TPA: hypothetical protein VM528_08580 [Burkholderiaceae bacterium]|nr:hypothetical protein [Burkholderiaceae bacterium]
MTTVLDKERKRQVDISGTAYTVVIDPAGLRLVEKGKRKPVALLAWKDPVSGDLPLEVRDEQVDAWINERSGARR